MCELEISLYLFETISLIISKYKLYQEMISNKSMSNIFSNYLNQYDSLFMIIKRLTKKYLININEYDLIKELNCIKADLKSKCQSYNGIDVELVVVINRFLRMLDNNEEEISKYLKK